MAEAPDVTESTAREGTLGNPEAVAEEPYCNNNWSEGQNGNLARGVRGR